MAQHLLHHKDNKVAKAAQVSRKVLRQHMRTSSKEITKYKVLRRMLSSADYEKLEIVQALSFVRRFRKLGNGCFQRFASSYCRVCRSRTVLQKQMAGLADLISLVC